MSVRGFCLVCLLFAASGIALAQAEPELISASLPKYPDLAVESRAEGVVKLSFTIPASGGQAADIAIVSGAPLFNTIALENVKTWRFANPSKVDRKCETTFTFRFSGETLPSGGTRKTVVSFESFDKVDVMTDFFEPVVNKNY